MAGITDVFALETIARMKTKVKNWHETKVAELFQHPLFGKEGGFAIVLKSEDKKKNADLFIYFRRLGEIPRGSNGLVKFSHSDGRFLKDLMSDVANEAKKSTRVRKRTFKALEALGGLESELDSHDVIPNQKPRTLTHAQAQAIPPIVAPVVAPLSVEDTPCELCGQVEAEGDNDMPICSKCNKGYHLGCIGMDKKDLPEDDWFCDKCLEENALVAYIIKRRVKEAEDKLREELASAIRTVDQKINTLTSAVDTYRNQGQSLLETVIVGKERRNKKTLQKLAAVVPDPGVVIVENKHFEDKSTGCSVCGEAVGHYVCLENLKDEMAFGSITSPSDPRRFTAKIAQQQRLHKVMVCKAHSKGRHYVLDKAHKLNYCMVCRDVRSAKSEEGMCKSCTDECLDMRRAHATRKHVFEKCMRVVQTTVLKCRNITFHHESVELCNDGTDGSCAADSVMEILTTEGKKIICMVEFQNTHRENPSTLTHKFLSVCAKTNPHKACLMNVRISGSRSEWKMEEKMDIFRRWIVFIIYYHERLPSRTYWEFFQGDESPLEANADKSKFLSSPLVVDWAPQGIIANWEFASDPYAGYIPRKQRKKDDGSPTALGMGIGDGGGGGIGVEGVEGVEGGDGDGGVEKDKNKFKLLAPWHNIISKERDIKTLAGASFPNKWIGVYNVDEYDKLQHMQCKDMCEVCAKYF